VNPVNERCFASHAALLLQEWVQQPFAQRKRTSSDDDFSGFSFIRSAGRLRVLR
jgi:hypothetical protein